MGRFATDTSGAKDATSHVERVLRDELARGDQALGGVAPVLSHMLASSGHSLVSEVIVARLRGMLESVARQLLAALLPDSSARPDESATDALSDHLAGDSVILSYCYTLAMEGHLAERLEQRSSLDPILSPLLQELVASEDGSIADLAMSALAAQSRFVQSQRRMDLPLAELPAELFHTVLKRWDGSCSEAKIREAAIAALKTSYDEGANRVGLLARLVSTMRGGAVAALELDHAGLALFVSGLSSLSQQPRELAVLACHERQAARLALSLRASGLNAAAIERQFLLIEPAVRLPQELNSISPERAKVLLGQSAVWGAR